MVQERDFLGSADGATAPESLRQKDPETVTIWREANHSLPTEGDHFYSGTSSQVTGQMGCSRYVAGYPYFYIWSITP